MPEQGPAQATSGIPGAAQEEQREPGGDVAGQVAQLGSQLEQFVSAISEADAPDEAKQAFAAALEAFKAGFEALSGGGGQGGGVATPEQGASGAVPMSHGGMRR